MSEQREDRTTIYSHAEDDPRDWRTVAAVEGWGWFNDCELQRDDSRNEFASDLHATMHVITRAVADEESPHMAFLRFWRTEAPEAYMDTMCALVGSIPGFEVVDETAKLHEIEAAPATECGIHRSTEDGQYVWRWRVSPSDVWSPPTTNYREAEEAWKRAMYPRPSDNRVTLTLGQVEHGVCPSCGDDEGFYPIEDIGCRRGRVEVVEDRIEADGYYTTEGFDEAGEDERLMCGSCCAEFNLPEGHDIHWV